MKSEKHTVKSVCIVLQTIEHKKRTRKVPKSQKHFSSNFQQQNGPTVKHVDNKNVAKFIGNEKLILLPEVSEM